jgi:hypothetical protein
MIKTMIMIFQWRRVAKPGHSRQNLPAAPLNQSIGSRTAPWSAEVTCRA